MKLRNSTITWLTAAMAVGILRLLFRSVRRELHIEDPRVIPYGPADPEAFVVSVWHDSLLIPTFCGTGKYTAALVSRHQDGSYLAYALKILGLVAVRGSTGRGGAAAVRQLMTLAREKHVVITPDGPRGPRRQVKKGIVFLASQSGRSIVPTAYACARAWRIKGSWTDLVIPKPFAKAYLVVGAPMHVPPNLSRDDLDRHTQRLQDEMDRLDAEAERLASPYTIERAEGFDGHSRVAA